MLFDQSTIKMKSPIPFGKIRHIEPVFGQTYVVLNKCEFPTEKSSIFHINKDGNIIGKYLEGYNLLNCTVSSSTHILVPFAKPGVIVQIDLENKSTREIQINFKILQENVINTFFFTQNNLLCFWEVSFKQRYISAEQDIRLTYLKLPLAKNSEKMITFQHTAKPIFSKVEIKKINNTSSVAILTRLKNRYFELLIHELVFKNGLFESKVRKHEIKQEYCEKSLLYLLRQNELFLEGKTARKKGLILNIETGQHEDEKQSFHRQFLYQDIFFLDEVTVFQKRQNTGHSYWNSLLSFFDNENKQLIQRNQYPIENDCEYHINTCQYSPSMLVEWGSSKKQKQGVFVQKTKKLIIKQVFMHFLLCLNEEFDDDLLQDALRLLGFE